MTLTSFLDGLQSSHLAVTIRDSLFLFPLLEAVHVIALTLVFGTIMIVDLRMLGIAGTDRSYGKVSSDLLKWTWGAFALAAVTGSLMFITNARVYADNPFFRAKFVLMALAGLNMLVFQLTLARAEAVWGQRRRAPARGRIAAVLSLLLWLAVIGMGRTVGFTTTGAQAKETKPAPDVNFDDFLNSGPSSAPPSGG